MTYFDIALSNLGRNNNLCPIYEILLNLDIRELYDLLYSKFGETGWWPADTPDEVIIGSILTQNTAWKNVEISLQKMKENDLITLGKLSNADVDDLGQIIKSSGFFRQKATRLVDISTSIIAHYGSTKQMKLRGTEELQIFLSSLKGIGQETMDCILLYVLEKPEFVVDKYTLRIMDRIGIENSSTITEVKALVENSLNRDLSKMKNLHGMFVELAKNFCKVNPICSGCPVKNYCNYGKSD